MYRLAYTLTSKSATLRRSSLLIQKSLPRPRRRTVFTLGDKPDDGVVLKIGSLSHRIHQKLRSLLSQGIVFHAGKIISIVSTMITDYAGVRLALLTSALCSTTFHFLFPDPRPVRMFYGFIFALGNAYALFIHSLEHSNYWTIQDEKMRYLYETFLKREGFTVYHMQRIMDECDAEQINVKKGEYLLRQNDEMFDFYIVIHGEIEFHRQLDELFQGSSESQMNIPQQDINKMFARSHVVSYGTKGTVVGEVFDPEWDPSIDHYWRAGVYCSEDTTFLKVNRRKYQKYAQDHPAVRRASNRLTIRDLWRARRATGLKIATLEERIFELGEEIKMLKGGLNEKEDDETKKEGGN